MFQYVHHIICSSSKKAPRTDIHIWNKQPVIGRLTYKSEKEITLLMKLLMDFHLLEKADDVYIVNTFTQKKKNTTPTKKVPKPPKYEDPVAPDSEIDWR